MVRAAASLLAFTAALSAVEGCGVIGDITNTDRSYPADNNAGSTKEIKAAYPAATDITVHHYYKGVDNMTWNVPGGGHCTVDVPTITDSGTTPNDISGKPSCFIPSPAPSHAPQSSGH